MDQYLHGPSVRVELWLLSLPQARLTLSNSPSAPCWELLCCLPAPAAAPASVSAASTSCLQEGPTSTTFFHFLCCALCFRVADYYRPVAMTDCCCCPSTYWPHKIVQQSTGLLRPLVNSRVLDISATLYSVDSALCNGGKVRGEVWKNWAYTGRTV